MDTQKFSQVVSRLEGVVQGQESKTTLSDAQLLVKFESLVSRLESLQGTLPEVKQVVSQAQSAVGGKVADASGSSNGFVADFKAKCFANVPAFEAATKEIGVAQLDEGVKLYLTVLKSQEAVLATMAACSKPADDKFMVQIA